MEINNLRLEDLHWIAGFLEGEGTFCKCGGTIQVAASQVEKDPIDKLYKLIGGGVIFIKQFTPTRQGYWRWSAYGETAELLIKAIYPLMSIKRKNKILEVLSWYASRSGRNFGKSGRKTCRKGLHQWNEQNTYVDSHGMRTCRLCKDNWFKKRRELKSLIFN